MLATLLQKKKKNTTLIPFVSTITVTLSVFPVCLSIECSFSILGVYGDEREILRFLRLILLL